MSKESFAHLLHLISPHLKIGATAVAERNQRNANAGHAIPKAAILACAVRLLAGAQVHDLILIYDT